ncbi:hypothetical protein D6851_13050 [Altericroceibacterium spongiae]|uniref:Uncharacterized protein n=1 Tax=Altericroceibacterium spongiae TaxID=2320269 RepID=A0A420EF91_9SPHN|nr:DUF6624 domain-containing protein [Altericroceibacterium spongiae]RKF19371.1 hypothetical protein D6851_13050 [Altericroceibacterium spongiae]
MARPADFAWLRGGFAEATPEEKQNYAAALKWLDACRAANRQRILAKLEAMGISDPERGNGWSASGICGAMAERPSIDIYSDYAEFSATVKSTRAPFDAMLAAIDLAEKYSSPHSDSLADALLHRPLAEQVLRNAVAWIDAPPDSPGVPALSDKQKPIFRALLFAEIGRRDETNTTWLKQVVQQQGWPTISRVGKQAAGNAWLLAQHADRDPAFQLQVLRLMEPLMENGEVSSRHYAYLYDRVMLKLTGTQTYATQVTCKDGKYIPLPLKDKAAMPDLRRSVGLEPFETYLEYFFTPCS